MHDSDLVPYKIEPREDTGLYNAKFGIWLFLASEIMLFGSLFSAYILLRVGSFSWPVQSEFLNVPIGAINSVILLSSSIFFSPLFPLNMVASCFFSVSLLCFIWGKILFRIFSFSISSDFCLSRYSFSSIGEEISKFLIFFIITK